MKQAADKSSKVDRVALRALCESATPGPWRDAPYVGDPGDRREYGLVSYANGTPLVCGDGFLPEAKDARFIAVSRTALPALLDLLDEIERERDNARTEIERVRTERDSLSRKLDIAVSVANRPTVEYQLDVLRAERDDARTALAWFADEGHYTETYRVGSGFVDALGLTIARAGILGLDPDDADAVNAAWRTRSTSGER